MIVPLLTLDEVAEALKVSASTIRRQVRAGRMPVRWVGESMRFDWEQVKAGLPEAKPRPVAQKVRPIRKGVSYLVDHLKREVESWPRS